MGQGSGGGGRAPAAASRGRHTAAADGRCRAVEVLCLTLGRSVADVREARVIVDRSLGAVAEIVVVVCGHRPRALAQMRPRGADSRTSTRRFFGITLHQEQGRDSLARQVSGGGKFLDVEPSETEHRVDNSPQNRTAPVGRPEK